MGELIKLTPTANPNTIPKLKLFTSDRKFYNITHTKTPNIHRM